MTQKNRKGSLFIRNVDQKVKTAFRIRCLANNTSMTHEIQRLMAEYAGVTWKPANGKKQEVVT